MKNKILILFFFIGSILFAFEFEIDFKNCKVSPDRPFKIYDFNDNLIMQEIFERYSDPKNKRAGHTLMDPPFEVNITGEGLYIYDNKDILLDNGRSISFITAKPVFNFDVDGFIFYLKFGMLKGYRHTGCAFFEVALLDDKNRIVFIRGHDKYGRGCDYNARLVINGKAIYDEPHDDIKQPEGFTEMEVEIINLPFYFEYKINGRSVIKDSSLYVNFDESKMKIKIYAMRWNWKGPLKVLVEKIGLEFF